MSKKHPLLQNEIDQERQLRAQLAARTAERDLAVAEAGLLYQYCENNSLTHRSEWAALQVGYTKHAEATARVLQAAEMWREYWYGEWHGAGKEACEPLAQAVDALRALAQPETEPSAPAAPVSTT